MLRALWHLVPARIRRQAVGQVAVIAASTTEPLAARIDAGEAALTALRAEQDGRQADLEGRLHHYQQAVHGVESRLHGVESRLHGVESGLATLQESADHLERVAMPAATSRAEAL